MMRDTVDLFEVLPHSLANAICDMWRLTKAFNIVQFILCVFSICVNWSPFGRITSYSFFFRKR